MSDLLVGDQRRVQINRPPMTPDELWWFTIGAVEDCWIIVDRPYPEITRSGVKHKIHRLLWEVEHGIKVPPDLELDHLCKDTRCVNPHHLEAVSHRLNVMRGDSPSAGHAAKTHCPQGHEYDALNTYWRKPRTEGANPSRECRACRREGMRASRPR